MAVQARHLSHDFLPATVGASLFLDDYYAGWCAPAPPRDTTVLGEFPHSDLAAGCNYAFVPRKRPRLAAAPECFVDDQGQGAGMAPAGVDVPCGVDVDVPSTSRAAGSGAASTSGRLSNGSSAASRSLVSWMHRQGVELDAVMRLEAERMRLGLEDARRRHAGALVAAVCRAASARLRAAEAELERALRRNAELEDKCRQVGAECEAWMGVARSHEAVAAGLRATLDQLLLQSPSPRPSAGGDDAEDAQSCCGFEADADEDDGDDAVAVSRWKTATKCGSCGGGEARVLVLPCRHLCLCRACEARVDACPVCAVARNGSLHVLLS